MAFLFVVMAFLALFGLLDAIAGIHHAWRRATGVIENAPLPEPEPSNVRLLESKVRVP